MNTNHEGLDEIPEVPCNFCGGCGDTYDAEGEPIMCWVCSGSGTHPIDTQIPIRSR